MKIKHVGVDDRTHASIQEICRYVTPSTLHMTSEQIRGLRKDLVIDIANEAHIQFWLQEVSRLVVPPLDILNQSRDHVVIQLPRVLR